jgi:hypothetical protein
MASATMEPSPARPAAMNSTSCMGTTTLESAARAGRSTAYSITWAEPVAVATPAHARCIVPSRTPCIEVVAEATVIASAKINRRFIR